MGTLLRQRCAGAQRRGSAWRRVYRCDKGAPALKSGEMPGDGSNGCPRQQTDCPTFRYCRSSVFFLEYYLALQENCMN
ncbi:hypothetical protein Y032_0003g1304 [Ancylostoma ceylanicum]|uniref:Uncharacterized protein n=1 Tax=Ancylostoma ceylanicum TaxID=53326 RepID=A0A016VWC8_9BILA|nr:hypothetical protein Y032_0003g1304 [Ancylostoma ceylanicum]